ncbi:MAG: HAMP domain-containing methyl-accepting chemotaxis protein [Pseudomonadota bacterium]
MLNSISISRRVATGFVLVTLLVIVLAVLATFSVRSLGQSYSSYRTAAQQTHYVDLLAENMLFARAAAMGYRASPSQERADEVAKSIESVLTPVDGVSDIIFDGQPEQKAEITALAEDVRTYFAAFGALKVATETNAGHIEDVRVSSERAAELFAEIQQSFVSTGNFAFGSTSSSIANELSAMRVSMQKFIQTENAEDYQVAQAHMAKVTEQLPKLGEAVVEPDMADKIEEAVGLAERLPKLLSTIRFCFNVIQKNGAILDDLGPKTAVSYVEIAKRSAIPLEAVGVSGQNLVDRTQIVIPVIGLVAVVIALLSALFIGRWISVPVRNLAEKTSKLAEGNTDVEITGTEEKHELGDMARALAVFKTSEEERRIAASELQEMQQEQERVVSALSKGLGKLAEGDLTHKIDEQFAQDYEQLRSDFNSAVEALSNALQGVYQATHTISSASDGISHSSMELSQRTENQAASLEQTAAALDELTSSMNSTAQSAKEVSKTVESARTEAEQSGAVVKEAVEAMGEIKESSSKITKIISVIDDIAFQTNLLALNAGVEAARAGDSGKGFAVVASEVRALAQRSSDAAKEISQLIQSSSNHVQSGTTLVGNAGQALSDIIERVNHISTLVSDISHGAQEQSVGLSEINVGVNQLDQVTQQNAAMVDESTSRGQELTQEAHLLSGLVSQFKVSQTQSDLGSAAVSKTTDLDSSKTSHKIEPYQSESEQIAAGSEDWSPKSGTPQLSREDAKMWENF